VTLRTSACTAATEALLLKVTVSGVLPLPKLPLLKALLRTIGALT